MEKIKTTITLSVVTYEKIKELAESERRSISAQINVILDKYFETNKKEG